MLGWQDAYRYPLRGRAIRSCVIVAPSVVILQAMIGVPQLIQAEQVEHMVPCPAVELLPVGAFMHGYVLVGRQQRSVAIRAVDPRERDRRQVRMTHEAFANVFDAVICRRRRQRLCW